MRVSPPAPRLTSSPGISHQPASDLLAASCAELGVDSVFIGHPPNDVGPGLIRLGFDPELVGEDAQEEAVRLAIESVSRIGATLGVDLAVVDTIEVVWHHNNETSGS